ncbi:hypothetical protein SGRIM128S_03119 [Streptomyces griseomycini]
MSPTGCPPDAFPPYGPVMNDTALTVHQIARPHGFPTAEHFTFIESTIPDPAAGSALVENLYWSVDPYHREMMDDVPGGFALGAPLEGRTIGRVIASRTPRLAEGDIVFHRQGWRTHMVVTPEEIRRLPLFDGVPPTAYLSVLGGTGLTAYVALTRIARLQEGEDLFVSAAAGGVGTATGRFAGCSAPVCSWAARARRRRPIISRGRWPRVSYRRVAADLFGEVAVRVDGSPPRVRNRQGGGTLPSGRTVLYGDGRHRVDAAAALSAPGSGSGTATGRWRAAQ